VIWRGVNRFVLLDIMDKKQGRKKQRDQVLYLANLIRYFRANLDRRSVDEALLSVKCVALGLWICA